MYEYLWAQSCIRYNYEYNSLIVCECAVDKYLQRTTTKAQNAKIKKSTTDTNEYLPIIIGLHV